MTTTAMLCWYDEPPQLLRQAVRGAALFCDRLVAADGAYEFVPDRRPSSPRRQTDAIRAEAAEQGMGCVFLEPRIWPGQVAKRDAVLQEAKQGSDWVMALDADWLISGDRDQIRGELEALHTDGFEQVLVNFVQPVNPDRPLEETCANVWHELEKDQWRRHALIYRSLPVMHYEQEHWSLYCLNEAGDKVGLWGGYATRGYGPSKTASLRAEHLFQHLCLFRDDKQILRNREYIRVRDAEAQRVGFET